MKTRSKKVTMQDVAKKAGVSYQTVSRVLNNSCNVSETTKSKIQQAIMELGYVPNFLAQQLVKKERRAIGLVISLQPHRYHRAFIEGVRRHAEEFDYSIVVILTGSEQLDEIQAAVFELRSQLVDRIIIDVPMPTMDAIALRNNNAEVKLLFVYVDPYSPVFNVTFNPSDGTLYAVSHLQKLGHRRVALLAGPEGNVGSDLILKGWREALRINNMEEVCTEYCDGGADSGYYAGQRLLRNHQDFTAVLCASDKLALGLISALDEHKLRVPEDISVIGYDGSANSAYYLPSLTSIHLDYERQSRLAVEKLIDAEEDMSSTLLPTRLILRRSSARVLRERTDFRKMADMLRKAADYIELKAAEYAARAGTAQASPAPDPAVPGAVVPGSAMPGSAVPGCTKPDSVPALRDKGGSGGAALGLAIAGSAPPAAAAQSPASREHAAAAAASSGAAGENESPETNDDPGPQY